MGPAPAVASAHGPNGKPDQPVPDAQSVDNLDASILATMRHQERLQPAVQALRGEQVRDAHSGFAGLAFEGEGLALYHKGQLGAGIRRALSEARRYGEVTVKNAPFSLSELEAEGRKIHKMVAAHGASDIQEIGYRYDGGGLTVERMPPTLAESHAKALARRGRPLPVQADRILAEAAVEVPVTITTADAPLDLWVHRLDDTSPWNGGGRFETWRGGDRRASICTTGFGVNASGRTWVLTAAHCGTTPDVAYQGIFNGGAGTDFQEMGPVHSDQWRYDMMLINAPGWYLIFDGSATTSTTKRVNAWGHWAANELVCQSGARSGTVCGIKQERSTDIIVSCATPDSDGDCGYTISGVIKSRQINGSVAGRSGDSGGPVFTLSGSGVRAKGTTVGGSSNSSTFYFQDWADAIRLFGAYPRTS